MTTLKGIQEGNKVFIRGQKGQHIYEVERVAPESGLASLKKFKRIVALNRLVKVANSK